MPSSNNSKNLSFLLLNKTSNEEKNSNTTTTNKNKNSSTSNNIGIPKTTKFLPQPQTTTINKNQAQGKNNLTTMPLTSVSLTTPVNTPTQRNAPTSSFPTTSNRNQNNINGTHDNDTNTTRKNEINNTLNLDNDDDESQQQHQQYQQKTVVVPSSTSVENFTSTCTEEQFEHYQQQKEEEEEIITTMKSHNSFHELREFPTVSSSSSLDDDDEENDDDDHEDYSQKQQQQQQQSSPSMEQLIQYYNNSPISKLSNGYFNLHRLVADSEGLLTVPYPTAKAFDYLSHEFAKKQDEKPMPHPSQLTKIFFGQLPFVGNLKNLVRLMIFAVAGIYEIYGIDVKDKNADPEAHIKARQRLERGQKRSANANATNKVTCPLVTVTVHVDDVEKIVSRLHLRVIVDQTAFQVATAGPQSIKALNRYEKMQKASHKQRFQCRPYTAVTVTRANPPEYIHRKGEDPFYKNMRNPLCECQACRAHYRSFVDYSSLCYWYLPQVALTTPTNLFSLNTLVEVHSNITTETFLMQLTEAQKQCTSEVSDEARLATQRTMSKKWFEEGFKVASYDDDWKTFRCNSELTKLFYYNSNNSNQQQQNQHHHQ